MKTLFNPVQLLPFDGRALSYTRVFRETESDRYLEILEKHIPWKQESIKVFGKMVLQPRLTAWYGDDGMNYHYSGITLQPAKWTPELLRIRKKLETITGYAYNSALLNLYRDGRDSMGWHRDNEKELGHEPVIASVSFGAERLFRFRNAQDKKNVISTVLRHGSVLLMTGPVQDHWQHNVPKTKTVGTRINITFRMIKTRQFR